MNCARPVRPPGAAAYQDDAAGWSVTPQPPGLANRNAAAARLPARAREWASAVSAAAGHDASDLDAAFALLGAVEAA
jgi:hypothetical protein